MEEKKKLWKNWKFWVVATVIIVILAIISILVLRNNMTAEETVSKFMYLIENKDYEKAKKLCSKQLEHLDLLANIKPSSLSFKFSEDKKEAKSVLLEEEIKVTKLNVKLEHTLMGYKIKDFNVTVEAMEPQKIEDRLNNGESVTDVQLLYWAESEIANKEKIKKYAKDNGMVAVVFLTAMKEQNYDKASELYQPIAETHLTVEQLKEYNWDNPEILYNFEIMKGTTGNLNGINIKIDNEELYMLVAGKEIMGITKSIQ